MEIYQLRYFVAVAHAGSFSRAAEKCHVAQPSLSQQIAKLEQHLGQRLFHRLGRRVVLTDAGQLLLERATAILSAVDDTERQLRDGSNSQGGRLAVGAIPTIAPYFLPLVLEKFLGRYPNVELTVHEDVTLRLIEATAKGEIDLALMALPITDTRLVVEPLLTEPLLLAMPPDHPLAAQEQVTLDDLRQERFIVLDEMHCLGEQILSFCRANECLPRVSCRSAQISTIQSLITTGQGVSLLPAMTRHTDGKQRTYRLLSSTQPTRTIAVIWHRHRYHSLAEHQFLAEVRAAARELESGDRQLYGSPDCGLPGSTTQ